MSSKAGGPRIIWPDLTAPFVREVIFDVLSDAPQPFTFRLKGTMDEDCVAYIRKQQRIKRLFQGKWTLQILCALRLHPVRLSQLKRLLKPASKKAILSALRSLEKEEVIVRRDLSKSVLHVEYEFTEIAKRIIPDVLDKMEECGESLDRARGSYL